MMGMDKLGSFGTKKPDDNVSEVHTDETESKESLSDQAIEDVERFLESLSDSPPPTEAPESVEAFLTSVEKMIGSGGEEEENEASFLSAVRKVSDLSKNLGKHSSPLDSAFNRASLILQKAMSFLEEEFTALLEDPKKKKKKIDRGNQDCCVLMSSEEKEMIRSETVARLSAMASAMVESGYEAECSAAYESARKRAFKSAMEKIGYEGGLTADEVSKTPWDAVAREIETWIFAARACSSEIFPAERRLGDSILPGRGSGEAVIRWATARLIGFAESTVVTKRSTDKVFKLLDMYEALRDLEKQDPSDDDVASAKKRIGEAAAGSFMELENSVKCEQGRTPVPSGGVHPVTRYVMNYVELACAYRETLEEVFREATSTELSRHVESVMEVLDANLEAKSRLYQDVSLNHIFLMNNGRYIVQKIKASSEIHLLMGDAWCRRRSSELRQNHKNYQRETWGKVLHCLSHEGLQAQPGGKVSKPVLKERFKSFNAMFDEIHKTQTAWVVSDDQLQSELRVSISAVMIPAYRAFLARFKHCLDAGRQTEKYIKYQPEDIETMIDDLFDGNPAAVVLRKRSNN